MWNTPPKFSQSVVSTVYTCVRRFYIYLSFQNLCIPLPPAQVSRTLMDNFDTMVSPAKYLLDASVIPPDPSKLPMPNAELLNKGNNKSNTKNLLFYRNKTVIILLFYLQFYRKYSLQRAIIFLLKFL